MADAHQWVLDAVPESLVALDARDRVVFANAGALTLFDARAADLVGRSVLDLLPERLRAANPIRAQGGGSNPRAIRLPVRRHDGVEIVVDALVSSGGDGHEADLLVSMRMLRETMSSGDGVLAETPEHEAHRLIFDHAPFGILHFNARGVITACNEPFVRIIGSSRRVLVGLDMCTLRDSAMVDCVLRCLRGEHARFEGDYRSVTAQKLTPVRLEFEPIASADGVILGGIGIVEDISARRAAEGALRASEARLAHADRLASIGALAAGVAHEMNNPLAYVMASLELVHRRMEALDGQPAPGVISPTMLASLRGPLADAREGAERVRVIVRDLRSFARADTTVGGAVDVERAIDSAANLVASEIRHRARLVKQFDGVGVVWGDQARLGQVMVNLLVNAAQAIPEGSVEQHEIRVRTRQTDDGSVEIDVSDTGEGIPADVLPRIFEPFMTTKSSTGGMGLGLSICHTIVAGMGGVIRVESEVRRGTTVQVMLPRPATLRHTSDVAPPSVEPPRLDRLRILVIDDEAILATTLRLAFSGVHDTRVARSGSEAIDMLGADDGFDVILCDLMMPSVSGIDVFDAVVSMAPHLAPRFVFMSGGAFTDEARAFLERVANPRLVKPFSLDEVERVLRAVRTRSAA